MPSARFQNVVVLAAICLPSMMFGLEISSVPVTLPALEKALGANFQDMQWIMNAYTIACTTVLMASGTLADRYGRKRVFIIATAAFGITSLMCGLAPTALLLIVSRFLQGMAGGAMFICSVAILSHQFRDGGERARAFAAWGVIGGIGLGFGPLIGGAIVALTTWHWVFLVHAPLAVLTIALIRANVQESRDPVGGKLDMIGIVTLTVAVFCLTYYITQGAELGWTSPAAVALIALTVVSFVAFVATENFALHPMFDFSVLRIPEFSGAIIGGMG